MSESNSESTPASTISLKRPLTSPFDDTETKKCLINSMTGPSVPSDKSTDSLMDPINHICLGPDDIKTIASLLKSSFCGELEEMVKSAMTASVQSIVDGVLSGLSVRVTSLEKQNTDLHRENERLQAEYKLLKNRMDDIELATDGLEQYSRRNCLRISGVPESEQNINTDSVVIRRSKDVGVPLSESDIDRSHRVGKPGETKPRQIVVKFTSYRTRQKLYRPRAGLKTSGHSDIYINEDLTKQRNKILFEARQLLRKSIVNGAWTSDGVIMVKDKNDRIHRVVKLDELAQFSYTEQSSSAFQGE